MIHAAKSRLFACTALLLLCHFAGSRAFAAVYLLEANIRTGYGATQENWTTYWSGACAERVSIEVGYTGRSAIPDILPRIVDYAQGAAPHVQGQCPKVEIIEVSAPGRRDGQRDRYQFEVLKSTGWQVLNAHWFNDRIRDSLDSSFVPAKAGSHTAMLRLKDGQLEVLYGKRLQSRLVGTSIHRHMLKGVKPAQISHHTISGHWYEIGSEQPNGRCEQSREGYALWGSFTMVLNRDNSPAKLIRMFCAEAGEKARGDEMRLTIPYPSEFRARWGIEPINYASIFNEQLAGMDLDTADNEAKFLRTRKALYEGDALRVYPAEPNWCISRRLDAYYRVPSEERDRAFGGSYTRVIGEHVSEIVNAYCGDASTASVSNYREGDETYWDRMSFQLRPLQASAYVSDKNPVTLLDQRLSSRARAHLEYLNANHLGPACSDRPFCELPGGRYLNAIYEGRGDLVQAMDKLNRREVNRKISGQMAQLNASENPLEQMFPGLPHAESGLILSAANKYMYAYAAWGARCLQPGATTRTFVHTTPGVEIVNFDGSTDYQPGETSEASYTINPDFFELLERVGSHFGAPDSDAPVLNKSQRLVLQGLVAMKKSYACSSEEVTTFERNLIALAQDALSGQPLRIIPAATRKQSIAPTAPGARSSPSSRPVPAAAAQAPRKRSETAEATDPVPTTPPTSTLSRAERYSRMNAEIKALSDAFMAETNALNAAFQENMKKAGTDAQRLEVLRAFNTQAAQMREENERDVQAIKDKYQN